jgi:hypothetical protein
MAAAKRPFATYDKRCQTMKKTFPGIGKCRRSSRRAERGSTVRANLRMCLRRFVSAMFNEDERSDPVVGRRTD